MKIAGNVKISGIEIKMPDGTVIKLTIDEARELHTQLDDIFKGVDPVYIPVPHTYPKRDYWPMPLPDKPIIWDSPTTVDTPVPRWPTVLCLTS